jgi:hypothetical protein
MDTGDAGTPQKSEVSHARDAKMQGKKGQPNFIPGGAPVGQSGKSGSKGDKPKK